MDSSFIIEIDASRGDQVAKKLLSRIALWGHDPNKTIYYVALLYPDTQYGKVQSEKFVRYGNSILKAINKKSSAYGIYLDLSNIEDVKVEYWDFTQKKKYKINEHVFDSMKECAKEAIRQILGPNCTYDHAKTIFNKKDSITFVKKEEGRSRHSKLNNTNIYVYTQWREYGKEWKLFKKICRDKGCRIDDYWQEPALSKIVK